MGLRSWLDWLMSDFISSRMDLLTPAGRWDADVLLLNWQIWGDTSVLGRLGEDVGWERVDVSMNTWESVCYVAHGCEEALFTKAVFSLPLEGIQGASRLPVTEGVRFPSVGLACPGLVPLDSAQVWALPVQLRCSLWCLSWPQEGRGGMASGSLPGACTRDAGTSPLRSHQDPRQLQPLPPSPKEPDLC